MLSQQARTGRIIVLTVLVLTVVMSAGMITLTNLMRGPDRIGQEAVRFLLTILLCVLVYQGKGWARWVYAALLGLGGLFALVSAVPLAAMAPVGALLVAAIGVVYLACAITLAAVPSVRAYFAERRAQRAALVRPAPGTVG